MRSRAGDESLYLPLDTRNLMPNTGQLSGILISSFVKENSSPLTLALTLARANIFGIGLAARLLLALAVISSLFASYAALIRARLALLYATL